MKEVKSLNVLIVDDVANMRGLLASSLRSWDISNITEAANANEALKYFEAKLHDIVFLDLQMPGVGGMAVLRSMKQIKPDAFIVIVSGESNVSNVKEAIQFGAKGFIVKPYTMAKLEEMIKKYLKEKA